MKKRVYILPVIAVLAVITSMLFCIGCSSKTKYESVTVSSAAELAAASGKNYNITLAADIDFGNNLVSSISCHGFDGDGHTFSNAVINGAAFFESCAFIKNLTLDNVTVNSQNNAKVSFIANEIVRYQTESNFITGAKYNYGIEIENVHVKNSALTAKNNGVLSVGGILCVGNSSHEYYEESGNSVKNCTVENTRFELNTDSNSAKVGGLCDGGNLIVSDSSVSDCVIIANTCAYAGGLFGSAQGTFTRCYAKNNNITAEYLTHSSGNALVPASGMGFIYAGGVFGRLFEGSTARLCYAENNFLTVYSSAKYYVGGLGGLIDARCTVNQCYALDTGVVAGGRFEADKTTALRYFGGLIGYVDGGAVTSCFASGTNHITDNDKPSNTVGEERNYGGLIGGAGSNVTVQYCAARGLSADETAKVDRFCPKVISGLIDGCYADGAYGNINNCAAISDDDWLTPSAIKAMLNLVDPAWNLQAGQMPSLDI